MDAAKEIRLTFLGGVGEIGMNCMAVETSEGIVIVDCGVMFPDGRYFGPDFIIPDLAWVERNSERIRAIVATHGHEDHIGAIPLAYARTRVPVYAPAFASALLREKALEYPQAAGMDVEVIRPGDRLRLAGLEFRFFAMAHSIPDALGFAIPTPEGFIVHTGDFRLDRSPTIGCPTDVDTLKELGEQGVLLLLSDSTNVERSGHTTGETRVAADVQKLVAGFRGRVLVSMFSSNVERLGLLAGVAKRCGRRLGLVGRSLHSYSRAAFETGLRPFAPDALMDPSLCDEAPPEEVFLLVAGSQGEPRSALTRVAAGEHNELTVRPGDMVIYSSKIIPGNERDILRVMNGLVRRGVQVFHEGNSDVHTSGHAMRDELEEVLRMTRPRFFVPVHGEYRFLDAHARLARETVGAISVVADGGDVLRVGEGEVRYESSVVLEPFYVEWPLVGNAGDLCLSERRKLMFNGLVVVECKRGTRGRLNVSDISTYGVPDPSGDLSTLLGHRIREGLSSDVDRYSDEELEGEIRKVVRRAVRKLQERRPLAHVVIRKS